MDRVGNPARALAAAHHRFIDGGIGRNGTISLDRDAFELAAVRVIIVDRIVLHRAVVPEHQGVRLPMVAVLVMFPARELLIKNQRRRFQARTSSIMGRT